MREIIRNFYVSPEHQYVITKGDKLSATDLEKIKQAHSAGMNTYNKNKL
jgi:hypothetical protein